MSNNAHGHEDEFIKGQMAAEAKDLERGPSPQEEARLAFVGALYAKAESSHLKRSEALIILHATLAEMLVPAIVGLKLEAMRIEPLSIPRHNADLMVEIAEELRAEALKVVDHAMANTRLVIIPRMPK